MTVIKRDVFPRKILVVKTRHTVKIMHEIMVEFTVSVMPKLVVSINDSFMVMENIQLFFVNRIGDTVKCAASPLFHTL